MKPVKTSQAVLDALRSPPKREMSATDRAKQRVSYIMGALGKESKVTRAEVEGYVAREYGVAAHS